MSRRKKRYPRRRRLFRKRKTWAEIKAEAEAKLRERQAKATAPAGPVDWPDATVPAEDEVEVPEGDAAEE